MSDTPECVSDPRSDFEPGRWLLVGPTWDELPERVRTNAWAILRHETGLINECGSLPWGEALGNLMKNAPEARVRVVACIPPGSDAKGLEAGVLPSTIASKVAARVTWHHRDPPDAGGSADPLQGLRTLLGPEPESLNFVAANGSTMLPRPRGLAEQHTQRWQRLLAAWARRQLERLHETADSAEEAWADWLANYTASEVATIVGDVGPGRSAVGNDASYALRAAGAASLGSFKMGGDGLIVEVIVPGRAGAADDAGLYVDIAVSWVLLQKQPVEAIELHDRAGPAIELRIVDVLPNSDGPTSVYKVWQLNSNDHPTLAIRLQRWRDKGLEVLVRGNPR